ncbi:hypothetical protein LOTGIDRAFT_233663 [Lottia gigantea]|uniref:TIR domain-containing protein n=1 Tax=Lottia gigantea TaxID=225164 RepID=V4ABH5_LOTGI|nr:hypothetical protein LOTGIDRAFT_233663 [Lottia gigantea]ESO90661.1 hypothetical protein LOTGIDRAFT_233663 [Lottia gigantea]
MESRREKFSLSSSSVDEDTVSVVSYDSAFFEETQIEQSEECKKVLNKVATSVSQLKNFCDQPTKICKQLTAILDLYFNKAKYRKDVAEELWRCGYASYAIRMFAALKDKDTRKSGIFKPFRLVVHVLWAYTSYSENLSRDLTDTGEDNGLIEEVCDFLSQPHNTPTEMMKNKDKEHIIMSTISVLRNIATYKHTVPRFQDMDVFNLVKRYSDIDKKDIKLITYTTMALIATEKQAKELTAGLDTFQYIVRLMSLAVGRDDINRIKERYMSSDLVLYLNKLTIDGDIVAILKTNILDTFFKMLKAPDREERLRTTICLYNISFNPNGREAIRQHKNLYPCLTTIEKLEKDPEIKHNLQGLLANLNPESAPPSRLISKTRHILINYNKEDTGMVKKIVERITAAGIEIWIDYKLGHCDLLGAISEAVAESSVVVVCLSEPFRQDPWCKGVAYKAIEHKKTFIPLCMQYKYKPEGWLEFFIPNERRYIDFSNRADFESSLQQFLQELKNPSFSLGTLKNALDYVKDTKDDFEKDPDAAIFDETKEGCDQVESALAQPESASFQQVISNPIPNHVEKMDTEKVKRWFIKNDLSKLTEKMKGMDGKRLWELQCMKVQNRDIYDNFLVSEYGLTGEELLNFDTALRNLVSLS